MDKNYVKKMTKTGQITVPVELRNYFGFEHRDKFELVYNDLGEIQLRRIEGKCILTGESDNLLKYKGKLLSFDVVQDIAFMYNEIMKEMKKGKFNSKFPDQEFAKSYNLADGFTHSRKFRNNKFLLAIEEENNDIERQKQELERQREELKKKEKELEDKKKVLLSKSEILELPIEERLTPEEIKKNFLKSAIKKLTIEL